MSIPPFPASPYDTVTAEMLEAELLAVITHRSITIDQLPSLMDRSFQALGQSIKAGLFIPVGPALAVYHGDPQATFDLAVGFPASGVPTQDVPTPAGVLRASALPAGPAAVLSIIGSYDQLAAGWQRLVAEAEGTPTGTWVEVYVSDPATTPEAQQRTDLLLPLQH